MRVVVSATLHLHDLTVSTDINPHRFDLEMLEKPWSPQKSPQAPK